MNSKLLIIVIVVVFMAEVSSRTAEGFTEEQRRRKEEIKEKVRKMRMRNVTKEADDLDADAVTDEIELRIKKNGGVKVMNKAANILDFYIDHILEIDADENMINKMGHHYKNAKAWTFKRASETTDEDYQGLLATMFSFSTTFRNNATLTLKFYSFRENGTITLYGENHTVVEGTTKFTMEITDWPFCGTAGNNCSGAVGTHLDVDFVLDGTNKGKKEESNEGLIARRSGGGGGRGPKSFKLGGATVSFSSIIEIDGSVSDMPNPFPLERQKGNKYVFSVRCIKFNMNCLYDPTVLISNPSAAASVTATMFISIISTVLVLLTSGTI